MPKPVSPAFLPSNRNSDRRFPSLRAEHLSDEVKRRFYKNYFKSKKKAFTKYAKKYEGEGKAVEAEIDALKAHATVIRVLAHTQIKKINNWGQKKSHLMEIQVCPARDLNPDRCSDEGVQQGTFHTSIGKRPLCLHEGVPRQLKTEMLSS